MPVGVVFPKTEADIAEIIRFANRNALGLIPRAAGTSLAGQCVGSGLVVDIGKHFTQLLSVDRSTRRVRVQPGSDGSKAIFGSISRDEFEEKCAGPTGLETSIYQDLRTILSDPDNRAQITANFPLTSIPRRNTDYALDLLMDADVFDPQSDKPFNLCKLIAGSEDTLFFATEIELDCSPLPPPHAALVCGHFSSINEALHANLLALPHAPNACELIDRHILDCTKSNLAQARNRSFVVGDPAAILVVEIRRDSHAEAEAAATPTPEQANCTPAPCSISRHRRV